MCRLAWSFPARICNKYLNHMKWYKQLCLTPSSTCLLFSAISEGSGETVQICSLTRSFAVCIGDKYQTVSSSLLFSAICKGPGDTAHLRSLARSFAARTWDKYKILHLHSLFFRYCSSHMRHIPNFLELTSKISLGLHLNPFFLGIRCSHVH